MLVYLNWTLISHFSQIVLSSAQIRNGLQCKKYSFIVKEKQSKATASVQIYVKQK